MWYIKQAPDATGNHGNPQGNSFNGSVALSDIMLGDYIETMGFAILTVSKGVVTAVRVNQGALDNYLSTVSPEPTPPDDPYEALRESITALEEAVCEIDTMISTPSV